jgi:hypothetical protein
VINSAVSVNYRIGTRDLGAFLRVSSRNRRSGETIFSATTPRVAGIWPLVTGVAPASVTDTAGFVQTPSRGAVTLRILEGGCAIINKALVAPPSPGSCVVRATVRARSPYPTMNNSFAISVVAP